MLSTPPLKRSSFVIEPARVRNLAVERARGPHAERTCAAARPIDDAAVLHRDRRAESAA